MNTNTKQEILKYIEENKQVRPFFLAQYLGISPQALHRHLKDLLFQNQIERSGTPPHVFYTRALPVTETAEVVSQLTTEQKKYLETNYLYVSADGHFYEGLIGFVKWLENTKQKRVCRILAERYIEVRNVANDFFKDNNYVCALNKFKSTFKETFLEEVFYQDFYSLPQFGLTKLGYYLIHAKQSQNRSLIKKLAEIVRPVLTEIIHQYDIDCLAWVPHSIPRKVSFLKEVRKYMPFKLASIEIVKAYSGGIPVAQKSLSRLEERIENAKKTFFIRSHPSSAKNILIIDDAIGSGATLNELSFKIKHILPQANLYGFAITGSYKGFEIIKEV